MEKYYKRKSGMVSLPTPTPTPIERNEDNEPQSSKSRIEASSENLQADPGLRTPILLHHPNERDQIRRAYLLKGPCQPRNHTFPSKMKGGQMRHFVEEWFDAYSSWLEYSVSEDAIFCLYCYLFKADKGNHKGGETFVSKGFSNWRKKERIDVHVGDHNSPHNQARRSCDALMNQNQHIESVLSKQSDKTKAEYRTRLTAIVVAIRYLLRQGLSFRGNDESEESSNRGNFLELLKVICELNPDIKAVSLNNAPLNHKLISSKIQKDIVNAIATEIVNSIIKDIGDSFFSILVDESRDVSVKEQMAVILRYVDKRGYVIERFIGVIHVAETSSSLKKAIDKLFSRLGLSISRLRGQGYDGASNMRGEFNGLKTLILKENEFAFYIHCFAHQLQLALVAVAKKHDSVMSLFTLVSNVVTLVGASCKRRDILREKQLSEVTNAVEAGELQTGRGLNQSTSLQRPGDTRWGSHYRTLINLIIMFGPVVGVLEIVANDAVNANQAFEAKTVMDSVHTFDFAFAVHLMRNVLGFANELSKALQRKDQDIVNAMSLVKVCKQRLQMMRDDGWNALLAEVSSFCERYEIDVPNMDDAFFAKKRSQRKAHKKTNLHHYRVELFYEVIDLQLQELEGRFNEANSELLLCVACLCPDRAFIAFNKEKLVRLAQFYPKEFSRSQLVELDNQLGTYIIDVKDTLSFKGLEGISALAKKMVETQKDKLHNLVYRLVTLALILPVATASVERVFSAMNIIKTSLRNRMEDQWMNDNMVVYIEKDIFDSIDNEDILLRFQSMKGRRGQL